MILAKQTSMFVPKMCYLFHLMQFRNSLFSTCGRGEKAMLPWALPFNASTTVRRIHSFLRAYAGVWMCVCVYLGDIREPYFQTSYNNVKGEIYPSMQVRSPLQKYISSFFRFLFSFSFFSFYNFCFFYFCKYCCRSTKRCMYRKGRGEF